MRETQSSGWNEIGSGYSKKVESFLRTWPHRLNQIKTANRIECLNGEDADSIPRIFLKSWDKSKAVNAQDDYITDAYARSYQLVHMAEDQSFADFYEATYKKVPTNGKLTLKTADEVQLLSTVCILEYKFLGGCDLQWKEKPAEATSFLPSSAANADEDACPGAAASHRPRRGQAAQPADNDNREPDELAAPSRRLDIEDILSWSWEDDEFPLNKLEELKFDPEEKLASQRTFHAASIILFYRKRSKEQEKVFTQLCGLWGEARAEHISHQALCKLPEAGSVMYTELEKQWCTRAQKALIAKMDPALRQQLEIPDSDQGEISGKRARMRLEGQTTLLHTST